MAYIEMTNVRKVFRVHKKSPGLLGALRGALVRDTQVVEALKGISFSAREGEMIGYIGPNGAGKSTSVKVMSGVLVPDGGTCVIGGRVPWTQRRQHAADIGVVFGQRSQLWWDNPVRDSFELLRDIYGVPQTDYQRRLGRLLSTLDAEALLPVPARQLSLGQRMRCELIAALLHAPKLLFLDEPTIGLDAVSKRSLRAFLAGLNAEGGTTMLLTTHDMDDIQALCRRVLVIGHGQILYDGDMDRLRAQYAPQKTLRAQLRAPAPPLQLPFALHVEQSEEQVSVSFDPAAIAAQDVLAALSARCCLGEFTLTEPDVEEVVTRLYRVMAL